MTIRKIWSRELKFISRTVLTKKGRMSGWMEGREGKRERRLKSETNKNNEKPRLTLTLIIFCICNNNNHAHFRHKSWCWGTRSYTLGKIIISSSSLTPGRIFALFLVYGWHEPHRTSIFISWLIRLLLHPFEWRSLQLWNTGRTVHTQSHTKTPLAPFIACLCVSSQWRPSVNVELILGPSSTHCNRVQHPMKERRQRRSIRKM